MVFQMFKKISIAITLLALVTVLAAVLCGCSDNVNEALEGKNVVIYEVNGGMLNFGTSSTKTNIKHYYYPDNYIKDPLTMPNYSIIRSGYTFTGWYTGVECKPEQKWDFGTIFSAESLTLYAGWEKEIKYTYSVYYSVNGNDQLLGSYTVEEAEKFNDRRDFANKRSGYTHIGGYYKDAACTEAWDFDFTHPGGENDLDVPVYVKHIEGEWKLVYTYSELASAIKSGNVYLMNDIDCEGGELSAPTTFSKIFEGNGYKVSNFTVKGGGTPATPSVAIFKTLSSSAEVRNVSFENVDYQLTGVKPSAGAITVTPNVAALAISLQSGAKIKNVNVSGALTTNYTEAELTEAMNKPFYFVGTADPAITAGISGFNATVTVTVQTAG